jgi:hypothetical protein
MNNKTITIVALGLALAAITYVTYNSLSRLNDIDYNLFEEDLEEDND